MRIETLTISVPEFRHRTRDTWDPRIMEHVEAEIRQKVIMLLGAEILKRQLFTMYIRPYHPAVEVRIEIVIPEGRDAPGRPQRTEDVDAEVLDPRALNP